MVKRYTLARFMGTSRLPNCFSNICNKTAVSLTSTKRHSFMLPCIDKMCDWRILASKKKTNCNYVFKKVNLENICPLDIFVFLPLNVEQKNNIPYFRVDNKSGLERK